jgi:hypothetical protein
MPSSTLHVGILEGRRRREIGDEQDGEHAEIRVEEVFA